MPAIVKHVILKHQKKEDGSYNVKLRVTLNRRCAYIATPYIAYKDDIDKKIQIKKQSLIDALLDYASPYRKLVTDMGDDVYNYTAKTLVQKLIKSIRPSTDRLNFMTFLKNKYEKMKAENKSSFENYRATYNHLYSFIGESLDFKEITSHMLRNFENHLEKKGIGGRGISLYMTCIRSTFNEGREKYNDYDLGEIKISNYPFSKYKIPANPQPKLRAAGVDVIISIINYTPKNETEHLAKDMFILSFYLIGMNARDILTCKSQIEDNRLAYQRSKTKDKRSDNAEISIKIEPEVAYLFDRYIDKDKRRTFNIYKRFANSKNFNMSLSDGLIAIRKSLGVDNLTFYSARHSWATIASHNCNIIDSHIAKCLNHVSLEHRITNKYIKRDWSLIDKCNRQVIDFVNGKLKEKSEP